MFDRLTSFVWKVERTIPVRYVNLRATIHQVVRNDDLRGGVMEERVNGEEEDNQGEAVS